MQQVTIGDAVVSLEQLELEDGDLVMDALVLCRVQRLDGGEETISSASSEGMSSLLRIGLLEAGRDVHRFTPDD